MHNTNGSGFGGAGYARAVGAGLVGEGASDRATRAVRAEYGTVSDEQKDINRDAYDCCQQIGQACAICPLVSVYCSEAYYLAGTPLDTKGGRS